MLRHSVTSAVTCTAATPEPIITLDSSGTCMSDSAHYRHLLQCYTEVMICRCYPLHLFVWKRRDSWPVPLTLISRHRRQVPGPSRSTSVISRALNYAVAQADPTRFIGHDKKRKSSAEALDKHGSARSAGNVRPKPTDWG